MMAKFFGSAAGWIIMLLVALIALVAGIAFGWFESGDSPAPDPSGTATPTATPTAFVDRPVTTGTYVPSAAPLTPAVLDSAGSGWIVAINDTSQVNTLNDPHVVTPDQKILYLISPDGTRYELANLDGIGLAEPDLVAWDHARDLLLLEQAGTSLNVFDMAAGSVTSSWTFCPTGYGSARYGEARDGNWVVRAGCEGEGVDALYSDAGVVVPSTIQVAPPMVVNYDIGTMQVRYEFEGTVEQKYLAYSPDGTSEPLPWNALSYCDTPLGKGRGETLAVACYAPDDGALSIEELPVDGTPPYEVVSAGQLTDFALANGGFGPQEFGLLGYWSDSALGIVQFWLGDDNLRLGVLYGGSVEAVGAPSYPFRYCHAVSGTAALVGGGGRLSWTDFDTGTDIVLLPSGGAGSVIQLVGSDGYTALRQP